MTRLTLLLGLSIATGLALLLAGCPDKPVQEALVEVAGDTVTFPVYTIVEGNLVAPTEGPYTKFAGVYPPHWPAAWKLDDRFYTPGGGIPEALRADQDQQAATWEFEGAFHGMTDELYAWFEEQVAALGAESVRNELDPVFKVIERCQVRIVDSAWAKQGLLGTLMVNSGPRYGEFTKFSFSVAQRIDEIPLPAEPVTE